MKRDDTSSTWVGAVAALLTLGIGGSLAWIEGRAVQVELIAWSQCIPGEGGPVRARVLGDLDAEAPTVVPARVHGGAGDLLEVAGIHEGRVGPDCVLEATSPTEQRLARLSLLPGAPAPVDVGSLTAPLELQGLPHIEVRVVGGGCVPEVPCTLLVRGSTAPPTVSECNVEVVPGRSEPPHHELRLTVHGPDARCTLTADGATASLVLPVLLAAPGVHSLWADATTAVAQIALPPGREVVFVELFAGGRWLVATHAGTQGDFPLPQGRPGPLRLQFHADPVSVEHSVVRTPVMESAPLAERFESAGLEVQAFALPTSLSSLPTAEAELSRARSRLRGLAGLASALTVVAFLSIVFERALRRRREDDALLDAARGVRDPHSHARSALRLAGFGVLLVLTLLAGLGVLIAIPYLTAPAPEPVAPSGGAT